MILATQQKQAYDKIMVWLKTKEKRFVLAGYAGTGKSTLAAQISKEIGESNVIYCAYTGKAANVLREKGCQNVGTLHSFTYILDSTHKGKPVFRRANQWESALGRAELVIVDEYSMLNNQIIRDIESLSKKVLYLGDNFQLPPCFRRMRAKAKFSAYGNSSPSARLPYFAVRYFCA